MTARLTSWIVAFGLTCLGMFSCRESDGPAALPTDPPILPGAISAQRGEYEGSVRQISFVAATRERTREIRDFYSRWAEGRGWRVVPVTEDAWSVDEWISYELHEDRVHQFAVVWRNDAGTESLTLAMLQRGDSAPIEVFLQLNPFRVISDPSHPVTTLEELEQRTQRPK